MGFDRNFKQIDMISTSRCHEIFKERSNQTDNSLSRYEVGIKLENFNINTSNTKKKKAKKGISKKKVVEFQPLIIPARIFGEKLDAEVTKKGGEIKLIGGCTVTIEENIFNKKTVISSYLVPPNKRQDFPVKLNYQEFLISEIFLVFSKVPPKKQLDYFIPSIKETNRYCFLISCTTENFQWVTITKFDFTSEGIKFSSDKWGYFAIVEKQPFENLNINSNGGLFNTRVHPMVSLRIPKNSCPFDETIYLQYLQNPTTTFDEMVDCYPYELGNMLNASSMISFGFPSIQFKRHITIKLPLPLWAEEIRRNSENNQKGGELMLLCKRQGTWEPIDARINYTKNTFTFDSKVFGTFILVEPRSNREGKIRHSLSRLEYVNNIIKGVILVFLYFESKSWYLWIELVSFQKATNVRQSREESGLIFIEKYNPPKSDAARKLEKKSLRKSMIPSSADCSRIVELSDGMIFHLKLEGDVQLKNNNTNIPIISKAFQKTIDAMLKKQSPTTLSNLQKRLSVDINEVDEVDDFLLNLGKKKLEDSHLLQTIDHEESTVIINGPQNVSIIFYRTLAENYRIIEIEPIIKPNIEDDVVSRWTQKELIKINMEPISEEDHETLESLDINDGDTAYKDISSIASDNSDMSSSLSDLMTVNKLFLSQTPESKCRVFIENEEEIEYTYTGLLTITRDSFCFQFPPNQLGPEYENQKILNNETKMKILKSYLSQELQSTYKYKFYLEPEEMRDYFGFQKPSATDIAKAKQFKAESLVNVYLKDVNLTDVDSTILNKAKKSAMKHIVDKNSMPLTTFESKDVNVKKQKNSIQHKSKDKFNTSDFLKEQKVLSNRSLQILSHYVEHGLTLAVHLQMSDSVITGIGFDSLSADQTMSEVTYKILVNWKKSVTAENRPRMVSDLIESLKIMKLDLISDIVNYAAQKNEELVEDFFLKPQNYLVRKSSPDHGKHPKDSKNKRRDSHVKTERKKSKILDMDHILEAISDK